MSIKSVVLVGIGGSLAPSVLNVLLASKFKVTVLTRKSSSSVAPSGVSVVKVADDYPHQELVEAFKGQDAVISMTTAKQEALIDAAIEAGVKRFIPSDFGADNRSTEVQKAVPFWTGKAEIREYLKSKESSGLTWTAIATGPFFDWTFKVTKGTFFKIDVANKKALIFDDGNHLWSASNLHHVGLGIVRVLESLEETKNKFIFIQSFSFTQNQILEGVEKELVVKFTREFVDGKKWYSEAAEKSAAGDIAAAYDTMFNFSVLNGSFENKKEYANVIIGLPQENFEESLKEALKEFKA